MPADEPNAPSPHHHRCTKRDNDQRKEKIDRRDDVSPKFRRHLHDRQDRNGRQKQPLVETNFALRHFPHACQKYAPYVSPTPAAAKPMLASSTGNAVTAAAGA